MAGDVLHLGISADVTFQRALAAEPGRRSRSSGSLPLRWTDAAASPAVLVSVAPGDVTWLSLRAVEPVALQIAVDGHNALTGEPLASALQWTPQDHLVLPEQRFFEGRASGAGAAEPLRGPAGVDGSTVVVLVARRLRAGAFRRWWGATGQDDRHNRFGHPPQVSGGATADPEPVPQAVSPDPFGPDDWDPDPFAAVEVHLVHPDAPPWNAGADD